METTPKQPRPPMRMSKQAFDLLCAKDAQIQTLVGLLRKMHDWLLHFKRGVSSSSEVVYDWDSRNMLMDTIDDALSAYPKDPTS